MTGWSVIAARGRWDKSTQALGGHVGKPAVGPCPWVPRPSCVMVGPLVGVLWGGIQLVGIDVGLRCTSIGRSSYSMARTVESSSIVLLFSIKFNTV